MVLVRRIRNRGANIVVEAHGEVLFAPTGVVGNWTRRFSNRITAFTRQEAPDNKRPRWAHYGKPLKQTITSSTTYQPGRMRVYSAVGASAPHAYYVDQGTGVYAGNGPYEAKILPPWQRGSASLYEHTWRPGGPGGRKVAPVLIKGQKGQFFFDAGLKRGFQSMRMRSFQVPGEGLISEALNALPSGLENFFGNTPADVAFQAQLEEWRAWRDEAWDNGEGLGRGGGVGSRAHERYVQQAAQQRRSRPKATTPKTPTSPKSTSKPKPVKPQKPKYTTAQQRALVVKALKEQGIPGNKVRNIQIKPDGTFTYEFRRAGGVWVPRTGRWRPED